tara:strand:- start:374 stop:3193 length:2820 start_codon:yes stop_codon:yes gene_type:complete
MMRWLMALLATWTLLAGCSSFRPSPYKANDKPTISDLTSERRYPQHPDPVKPQLEQVIEGYVNVLLRMQDPTIQKEAQRRIADLYLLLAEKQLASDDEGVLEQASTTLQKSISHYLPLLTTAQSDKEKLEIHYLLAKAYDLNLQQEASLKHLEHLTALSIEPPPIDGNKSSAQQIKIEAEFRLAERLFVSKEYPLAITRYQEVIDADEHGSFSEQALYKLGWSYYKEFDYQSALRPFFQLLDRLPRRHEKSSGSGARLREDTLRVVSLSFAALDGPASVKDFYQNYARNDYEIDIYQSLSQLYLEKERFQDAANALRYYIDSYPLAAVAPGLHSEIITILSKGGFPSLVLQEKAAYIQNYGVYSRFWQVHAQNRDSYLPALKGHLTGVSSHYHAKAQQSKKLADYSEAAAWYLQYLDTFPRDPSTPKMHRLLAELYYESSQYPLAIEAFEHVAYLYPAHEKQADAGYFAIQIFHQLVEQQSTDAAKHSWISKRLVSMQRFSQRFVDDERTPPLLVYIAQDLAGLKRLAEAVVAADAVLAHQSTTSSQRYIAQEIKANALFDLKRYALAESAYTELLALKGTQRDAQKRAQFRSQIAICIYKQAEALDESTDKATLAAAFLRVGQRIPESPIRANADYDAATYLLEAEQYQQAITILLDFKQRFAKHELIATVPEKLAFAYQALGQWANASTELEKIHNQQKDSDFGRQALWQAADLRLKSQEPQQAIRLFKKYVWGYPTPVDQRMEGQYQLTLLYQQTKVDWKETFWHNKLVETYSSQKQASARSRYLAARSYFSLSESRFNEFRAIRLNRSVARRLKQKTRLLNQLLNDYDTITKLEVAEFNTAATHRLGQLYQLMAKEILNSQRPKGLDEEELEEYEFILEEKAYPFEEKSISVYESNIQYVKNNIYTEWVKKSYKALAALSPARFNKPEQYEAFYE